MSRDKVRIRDHREVQIPLDGPLSYTAAGRSPIRCTRAELTYDIPTGRLCSVTVYGYLIDERDIKRRKGTRDIVTRRYKVDWDTHQALRTPGWLDVLIEDYRPAGGDR